MREIEKQKCSGALRYYCWIYLLYGGYLQWCTWNKPCFLVIQCCSCSVFTICATCNATSNDKNFSFHISTSLSLYAVPSMAVFLSPSISCFLVCCSGIVWMILRWFQLPLLLLVYYCIIMGERNFLFWRFRRSGEGRLETWSGVGQWRRQRAGKSTVGSVQQSKEVGHSGWVMCLENSNATEFS